jgi:acetolactate synthase-1/2/3 large subunit
MNLLLKYLAAEQTKYVFGVPGGALAEFMRAAQGDHALEFIVSKHETGGAFMADGYARVSGRLGVCVATTGPGATNMLTGVAVANADGVPVLALAGCTARADIGRGAFQETSPSGIDAATIFRGVGAFGEYVSDARALPVTLGRAIRHCWAGGGGAAFVGIPTDIGAAEIDTKHAPSSPTQYRTDAEASDPRSIARASELLAQAEHPCLFVGSGARRLAQPELLIHLAERLGAPVVTTYKAKGVFPEDHPLSLKNFGVASSAWAHEWIHSGQSDLLFVIGSSLNEWATGSWAANLFANRKLIQLDIDARRIGRGVFVDHGIVGHVEPTLEGIHRELDRREPLAVQRRIDKVRAFKASLPSFDDGPARRVSEGPLKPQRVVHELQRALPDDAIVFVDSGNTTFWLLEQLTLRASQQFHVSGPASMGFGFAASVGGKFAAPDRPVIAVGGDGALLMNGSELHTAVAHNLPLVWICFYDKALGTVKHGNRMLIETEAYSELEHFDPARFAESVGAHAIRIERPGELEEGLPRALAMRRPVLFCVHIDAAEPPPFGARIRGLRSQVHKEAIGGFGR